MEIKVLDKGFVSVIDSLGTDLTPVNAARVSFGKRKAELDDKDLKLIKYLKTHKHYSPFRHMMVQFHIKCPEVVARQLYKHVVGIETTSSSVCKDHAWNEISRRYVEIDDFYIPDIWRLQSESNKQASQYDNEGNPVGLEHYDHLDANLIYTQTLNNIRQAIDILLEKGVAKEQAQMLLPISFYTEFYWTASFQAIMNFLELRLDNHAQWEIQQYAKAIQNVMLAYFPNTTKIWLELD